MRAVEFLGNSRSRLINKPVPSPAPGKVVVRVAHNSVCGSDLWLFRGQWHGHTYPIVPGHEWSGVVADACSGDEAWVGTAVVGDLLTGCGTCRSCRANAPVMCPDLEEIGFTVDGAMAEYVRVPVRNLYAIPNGVELVAACQVEPLAVALHAVRRVNAGPGDRVAVLGCGGIGLLLIQAARAAGAEVILAVDPLGYRRELAARLGAVSVDEPGGSAQHNAADVVFEASGDPQSVRAAIELAAPAGRIALVGYQVGAEAPLQTAQWPLKLLTVVGVMGPGQRFSAALDVLSRGLVDVKPLLTDMHPLADHDAALGRAVRRDNHVIRVVFSPGD